MALTLSVDLDMERHRLSSCIPRGSLTTIKTKIASVSRAQPANTRASTVDGCGLIGWCSLSWRGALIGLSSNDPMSFGHPSNCPSLLP